MTGFAGTGFAGTGSLSRFALRRDRVMLPAWVYVITALIGTNAYTLGKLYPTVAARAQLAASGGRNPALLFLYGRMYGISVGAIAAWRYGVWAAMFASLMTILAVIRHTRADEEAGRLELVGSAAVGRHAPLTAAVIVAVAASAVLAVLLTAVQILVGLPAAGSVTFALAVTTCSVAFAFVAALAAQLTASARAARGIAIGVLGAAFVLRAVGDSAGANGPSWLSPLGWAEFTRPFAGNRWWVLVAPLALAAVAGGGAYVLAARRDLGAGLLPDRPGRPQAGVLLRGPFSLAWRLQRGTLASWVAGFVFIFGVSGAAAKGIGSLLGGSNQLRNAFTRLGGQAAITNAYLAALMSLAGIAAAAYATSAVLRLRSEETGQLAELVLSTATGRVRWGLSHLAIAVAGTAVVLAAGGLAAGLAYGLRAGDAGTQVASLLGAALAQLPASLAVAGVAIILFGAAPRISVAGGWAVVAAAILLAIFGPVLRLPQWALDISPFTHVPKLPGAAVQAGPLLWLTLAALVAGAAGLGAFRVRDIG